MKFFLLTALCAFFIMAASAVIQPQKQVIVTYSKDTPDNIMDQAKNAITEAVRTCEELWTRKLGG
jgi:hypothetical protein